MSKGIGLLLASVVAIGALYPGKPIDVANLVPVEVLVATVEENQVKLQGGGMEGYGRTWQEAMADLQSHGQAFFGATAHVVAEKSLIATAVEEPLFRPAAKIYQWTMPLTSDLESYFKVHGGAVTIADIRKGARMRIPIIRQERGGLELG